MKSQNRESVSRRAFLKKTALSTAGVMAFPSIVPASVLGPNAPSNRIAVGAIGTGRIAREADIPGVLRHDQADIVAVCDLDSIRLKEGKQFVETYYAEKRKKPMNSVKMYDDFRELLDDRGIDAVTISTPDHWHAVPAMEAAKAGKDIYLQKPTSLTIREGRILSDTVHRYGVIVQIGSQQRSSEPFRRACELVRNGRIGKLHTVYVGLPSDPAGQEEPEMPVPPNLNYEMWLGQAPYAPYTENRVHPREGYDRPGWLRVESYGAGMITGWGSHHVDTAHWGMGTEYTGPIAVEGWGKFPEKGLWNVHIDFRTEALYANDMKMIVGGDSTLGVRFEGSEGHVFVTRWEIVEAEPASILKSRIGPDEIELYKSDDHYGNWLECIRTRRQPAAPVEVGHRSCTACLIHQIVMHLGRRIYWDPVREVFKNDDEANSWLSRPVRQPWRQYLYGEA